MTAHNLHTQNSSDNLPSYLQTTIITQMLSVERKEGQFSLKHCNLSNWYHHSLVRL